MAAVHGVAGLVLDPRNGSSHGRPTSGSAWLGPPDTSRARRQKSPRRCSYLGDRVRARSRTVAPPPHWGPSIASSALQAELAGGCAHHLLGQYAPSPASRTVPLPHLANPSRNTVSCRTPTAPAPGTRARRSSGSVSEGLTPDDERRTPVRPIEVEPPACLPPLWSRTERSTPGGHERGWGGSGCPPIRRSPPRPRAGEPPAQMLGSYGRI